jgi:hypothetical protein
MEAQKSLPAGWEAKYDEQGRIYFLNQSTRKGTWHEPQPNPTNATEEPPNSHERSISEVSNSGMEPVDDSGTAILSPGRVDTEMRVGFEDGPSNTGISTTISSIEELGGISRRETGRLN